MVKEKLTIVLLPGLNGTEGLFKSFIECKLDSLNTFIISFPKEKFLSYYDLTNYVLEKISHLNGEFILVGIFFRSFGFICC